MAPQPGDAFLDLCPPIHFGLEFRLGSVCAEDADDDQNLQ